MTTTAVTMRRIHVVSRGEADAPEMGLFDPKLKMTVRYADPVSWITATAVARALSAAGAQVAAVHDRVGVLVVSEEGPQAAMSAIAEAAMIGSSSPLRYPAANPGALAGVSCILFGLRGPTINFVMPPSKWASHGLSIASGWLSRQAVAYALVGACGRGASGGLLTRCLILGEGKPTEAPGSFLSDADAAWLSLTDA